MPPRAKIAPKKITVHGDTRIDNYFWLRDRDDPDTIRYLEEENAYTEERMRPTRDVQKQLYNEMLGRILQTDVNVPIQRDDYFYYTRMEEGRQYSIYCRKHGSLDAPEQVLLDANVLAEGHEYFRIGEFTVSPNHNLLAYSVDYEGDESYIVLVKDLLTGEMLPDRIENTYYGLEWANDNATLFYTVLDPALRPYKVFRHSLGVTQDTLVYHEPDARFTLDISRTRSRAFVVIEIHSPVTSEVRVIKADEPASEPRIILPRTQDIEYNVSHHGDRTGAGSFFIRINDTAPTFRVIEAPAENPSKDNWKEIIPGRDGVNVENIAAFRDFLVSEERHRGLVQIHIRRLADGSSHSIAFPEPAYAAGLEPMAEFETNLVRFHYTSLITPLSIYDYNMETRERELKKQQPVLGGYDPNQYVSERLFAKAPASAPGNPDTKAVQGTVEVPISLVYRKGFVKDGRAPMLLYGYGSYGISIDPAFSSERLSLLDRGWVFAIAHIRGGGDLGKPWHDDGKMLKKKNTFSDFIASAEFLIENRYSSPDRIAINGRSAGGLLMGAVANMRPDLFAAIVAGVPFVDSLNTALDPTLPLTIGEYEEFGNPEIKEFYDYIKSYAPYENVGAHDYPAMLITAGLNDPRVSYWEPAKWTAKLRALKTDDRILLLKTNMDSGHFGASGRYEHLKETALEWAFLIEMIGGKGIQA